MTKKLFYLCTAVALCLMACHDDADTYTSRSARLAAERYYKMLGSEQYDDLVDATWINNPMTKDSIPADLRQEYKDMLKQFRSEIPRGGILSATALRDSLFGDSLAYVYLNLCFADSSHEEILHPLVYSRGKWWTK